MNRYPDRTAVKIAFLVLAGGDFQVPRDILGIFLPFQRVMFFSMSAIFFSSVQFCRTLNKQAKKPVLHLRDLLLTGTYLKSLKVTKKIERVEIMCEG